MRLALFFILLFIAGVCQSQWVLDTDAHSFEVDELGNVYLVCANRVELYNSDGEMLFVYNPSFTNRISDIDVSRALRPLVFFKDQGMLQYLDNTLSEQNAPVDLYQQSFGRPELVAASVDNHVWVFDSVNMELIRLDKSLSIVSRSGNLGSWVDSDAEFVELVEYQDQVYLIGQTGIFIFDLFGNFDHKLTGGAVAQVFFANDRVCFEQQEGWRATDKGGLPIEELSLPTSKSRVQTRGDHLFVLDRGLFINSVLKKD